MKAKLRRTLALFLCAVLCVGLFPLSALAEEEILAEVVTEEMIVPEETAEKKTEKIDNDPTDIMVSDEPKIDDEHEAELEENDPISYKSEQPIPGEERIIYQLGTVLPPDYEMDIKQRSFDASLRLFNAKWKILEEETRRLAEDKKKAEKRRAFFERVNSFENSNAGSRESSTSIGHLFFKGVNSQQSLKKRYRDLLKIYHPDEESGDMMTIQEINKEYDLLKQSLFN